MKIQALTKYIRMAPRKAYDVARTIQGRSASEALTLLQFSERKASGQIRKTLRSAIANAEHNHNLAVEDLRVDLAVIEEGPRMRRGWYGARGQFKPIVKRMSHVRVVLSDGKA
jgi:large subunit ribosomal protein L22